MSTPYTAMQLDALREVANIGSGSASTALSQLVGQAIDISVPEARAMPLGEAIESVGPSEDLVTGVAIPVVGDIPSVVLALFAADSGDRLARMMGVGDDPELARSALAEAANILGTHYVGSLNMLTGLAFEPAPPRVASDMLGAIVSSVLLDTDPESEVAVFIDTQIVVEGQPCSFSFLFVPGEAGAAELLAALGVA